LHKQVSRLVAGTLAVCLLVTPAWAQDSGDSSSTSAPADESQPAVVEPQPADAPSDMGPPPEMDPSAPAPDEPPPAPNEPPPAPPPPPPQPDQSHPAPSLHVSGNHVVNDAGQVVPLLGINRADTANMCLHGQLGQAPIDLASAQAIASWHATIVRVPLNEDCWLGTGNGVPPATGDAYRTAMTNYVQLLNEQGIAVILADFELYLKPTGASVQQDMPSADQTPEFWKSVASAFKGNGSVIFGLYNEPHPGTMADTPAAWLCLRDGGKCPGIAYTVAGTQSLVNAVRSTGATNIVLVPGVSDTNALSRWLDYEPKDPLHNVIASWHSYATQSCRTSTCWDAQIAPVAAHVPVIADEIGEFDCQHGYIDGLMNWLDAHQIGYLAWSWWVGDCTQAPALISDYDGTPTTFGAAFRDHLLSRTSGQ
jgi:endoglucanase